MMHAGSTGVSGVADYVGDVKQPPAYNRDSVTWGAYPAPMAASNVQGVNTPAQ